MDWKAGNRLHFLYINPLHKSCDHRLDIILYINVIGIKDICNVKYYVVGLNISYY